MGGSRAAGTHAWEIKSNHFTEMCCGYRGGLVFKAHRLLYHSLKDLLGPVTRVKKKKKKMRGQEATWKAQRGEAWAGSAGRSARSERRGAFTTTMV